MLDGKKVLSVITARRDSVGLPGKNWKILLDRSLVEWSILASLQCPLVDMTVVSSNCPKVEEATRNVMELVNDWTMDTVGRLYDLSEILDGFPSLGTLRFIQRPDSMATATSKNEEALIHAYEYTKTNFNLDADIIVNLQPTSPMRMNRLLERCLQFFSDNHYDSLLTACKETPFFWRKINEEWKSLYDYKNRPMRQEIKDNNEDNLYRSWCYHDDGSIYVMKKDMFITKNCRLCGYIGVFENDKINSLQIDSQDDFDLIEGYCKNKNITPVTVEYKQMEIKNDSRKSG